MPKYEKFSRREFVKYSGVMGTALPTFNANSYSRISGANNRLAVGIIGCGVMGQAHLDSLENMREDQNVEVQAVCDVYTVRAKKFHNQISEGGNQVKVFYDYRSMLDSCDLDYILIATPEHWHSHQIIDSLDAGFHVYCEKPITRKITEAHKVFSKVQKTGLKLQVGVQSMSDNSYEAANRAIRNGKLGPIVQAQVDYVRNYDSIRGPWRVGVDPRLSMPSGLDWNSWIGPAPKCPWDPQRFFEWRCYRDYSGGIATDLLTHRLTRILKACGLSYPERVNCAGGIYLWNDGRELPDNLEILLEYPSIEGITKGMTVHLLGTMANKTGNPHMIRGKHASLIFNPSGWEIISESDGAIIEIHQSSGAEDISLHHINLQDAIRSDKELNCPVELGLYAATALIGANQSWLSRRTLKWDDSNNKWV